MTYDYHTTYDNHGILISAAYFYKQRLCFAVKLRWVNRETKWKLVPALGYDSRLEQPCARGRKWHIDYIWDIGGYNRISPITWHLGVRHLPNGDFPREMMNHHETFEVPPFRQTRIRKSSFLMGGAILRGQRWSGWDTGGIQWDRSWWFWATKWEDTQPQHP